MTWLEKAKQFQSEDGKVLKREEGTTPNGNPLGGRWVLRDAGGVMVDFDQYRHDLSERYHLALQGTATA
jgi:hypothetical protein